MVKHQLCVVEVGGMWWLKLIDHYDKDPVSIPMSWKLLQLDWRQHGQLTGLRTLGVHKGIPSGGIP